MSKKLDWTGLSNTRSNTVLVPGDGWIMHNILYMGLSIPLLAVNRFEGDDRVARAQMARIKVVSSVKK